MIATTELEVDQLLKTEMIIVDPDQELLPSGNAKGFFAFFFSSWKKNVAVRAQRCETFFISQTSRRSETQLLPKNLLFQLYCAKPMEIATSSLLAMTDFFKC